MSLGPAASIWFFLSAVILDLAAAMSSPSPPRTSRPRYMGFDFGTSGARLSVIERTGAESGGGRYEEVFASAVKYGRYDDAAGWIDAAVTLLGDAEAGGATGADVRRICVSGTSASCMLVDNVDGSVTRPPCMYDFDVVSHGEDVDVDGVRAMDRIDQHAPPAHTARARTGILAKLLRWHSAEPIGPREVLASQSDYIAAYLCGKLKKGPCGSRKTKFKVTSDWHNCLKGGYDVRALRWPEWVTECLASAGIDVRTLQEDVVSPGAPAGTVDSALAARFGLPPDVQIAAGTTDSNAAFFAAAAGGMEYGTGVTSLGSTLAIKMLSRTYVEDSTMGVYSHRFPVFGSGGSGGGDGEGAEESWLVGGASNVGCAVLRSESFSDNELVELSRDIDSKTDSPLRYYPLTKKGERFPIADSDKLPLMEPVPEKRSEYLHGILQGISDVECSGYEALAKLGADPPVKIVWTCGGGGKNDMWTSMRERRLQESQLGPISSYLKVKKAIMTEASYGAALLAASSDS